MKNLIWIAFPLFLSACFSGRNQVSSKATEITHPTDTALARLHLVEAQTFLDSTLLDTAFETAKTSMAVNAHYSKKLNLDIAAVMEDIGLEAYSARNVGLMIQTFKAALELYKKAGEHKTIRVARLNNNLGIALRSTWQLKEALGHFYECLNIRLELQGEDNEDVAKTYNNIGVVLSDLDRNREALDSYEKSLSIKKRLKPDDTLGLALTQMNIGGIYSSLKNTVPALEIFEQVQQNLEGLNRSDALDALGKLHNNIAGIYTYRRDYYKAIQHHQQSIALKIELYQGENHVDVARSYDNLASVYLELKQFDKALKWSKDALRISIHATGDSSLDAGLAYYNIGGIYGSTGRFAEATENLNKALDRFSFYIQDNHLLVGECYLSLASVFEQQYQFEQALYYYQKSLEIFSGIADAGDMTPDMARTLVNMGLVYKNSGDVGKALTTFDRVINFQPLHKVINPALKFNLFEALLFKAELLANMVQSPQDAQNAVQVFEQALALGENFRDDLEENYDKADFLKLINRVAEGLILLKISSPLASEETKRQAFTIAEKSKSFLLQEGMRQAHALAYSGLSDSLRNKETDLRQDIEYYEKQFYLETSAAKPDENLLKTYNENLIRLKRDYKNLKDYLESNHPAYFELRYARSTETVENIQASGLLQPGQCVLEYFVGEKSIFAFLLKKNDYEVIEIKKDFALGAWIDQFRQGLYGLYTAPIQTDSLKKATRQQYAIAAFHLYEKLIFPLANRIDSTLIIIPDGDLGYLPFEALLTQKPEKISRYQSHQYFLLKHKISYAYSTGLLRKMKEKRVSSKEIFLEPFLGFAPYYYGSGNSENGTIKSLPNGPLPNSGQEIAELQKQLGGQVYYGPEANKNRFLNMAPQTRIIHLATHAEANRSAGDFSAIAFGSSGDHATEELLYAKDFFNIVLQAELVTLSACETGIGQLQPGEGIIGLSRAFAYAGAKSIVSSLWQVKDARTKKLMLLFYAHLKKGKTKDEALWAAKKDFLSSGKEDQVHPYFWSGFIAIGNMEAIF